MGPILLKSKLGVSKLDHHILARPVLLEKLKAMGQYAVTVITADAGYGKTTTLLQALRRMDRPYGWYTPGPEDDNVFIFSLYLAAALGPLYPELKEWYQTNIPVRDQFNWKTLFSVFSTGLEYWSEGQPEGILVIDDWFVVQHEPEIRKFMDRFLACKPSQLHVVLLSREEVTLSEISRLKASGGILEINAGDLTFQVGEVAEYVNQVTPGRYSAAEAEQIYRLTEGWAMAVRMLVSARSKDLKDGFSVLSPSGNTAHLFSYLAYDVLDRQPEQLQTFLLKTALVESFTRELCRAILAEEFKPAHLSAVLASGLFLYEMGNGSYRYHQLFREFLITEAAKRLDEEVRREIHRRVGRYFQRDGKDELALGHLIAAGQEEAAGEMLAGISRRMVQSGRGRLMRSYLQQLPQVNRHPHILMACGDEARFACHYKAAQDHYQQAAEAYRALGDPTGESHAFRGRGEIYLDIIQPLEADKYLRRAYKALPTGYGEEKASLIQLLAENMINRGDSHRAARYRWLLEQRVSYQDKNNFAARILLRTGKVKEAIRLLEAQLSLKDSQPFRIPCSFRESPLILSVCYSYAGQAEAAIRMAERGIAAGEQTNAPFTVAVGHYRKAHALLVQNPRNLEAAWTAYRQSEAVGGPLSIPRSRTEIFQGQCLLHGLAHDWRSAQEAGMAGVRITEKVGDNWFTAILYHTLGMAAALCGEYDESEAFLDKAGGLFRACGDTLGQTAGLWWQSYLCYQQGDWSRFFGVFQRLIQETENLGYEFLLQGPSLLGDISQFSSEPFFRAAQEQCGSETGIKEPPALPAELTAGVAVTHSAAALSTGQYLLDIRTLGSLKVWNAFAGGLISDWRRENARNLFCLFLTFRHTPLHKEAIMHHLWPEADGETGRRNFKVTLHTLQSVLEPDRQPRQAGRFIQRSGALYRFVFAEGVRLDVVQFEELLTAQHDDRENDRSWEAALAQAMAFYQGKFLAGEEDFDWLRREQERLDRLYIRAGDELTRLCIRQQRYEDALRWAETVTQHDPCWERSYQYMLWCYGKMQNSVMVARVYNNCCRVLAEELGIRPSRRTREIYQRFTG
ncbi:MAG TPA: BTAD domain-containing putative transcriptional regulator [Patescibacteria group bacterium]|nr:BTAD domain-containing putative transcriptional regulator [Patescibacteria group bacterium]